LNYHHLMLQDFECSGELVEHRIDVVAS
jgi:hypothetical protein